MVPDPSGGGRTWNRIEELYHQALERPQDQRARFLDDACEGDEDVRREVVSLLEALERDGELLEAGGLEAAARILAGSQAAPATLPPPGRHARAAPDDGAPAARKTAPLWLYLLAAVFLADCLLRGFCHVWGPAGLGFTSRSVGGRLIVEAVRRGSAAEHAGVEPGDVLLAIDGHSVGTPADAQIVRWNLEVGRVYRLEVQHGTARLPVLAAAERLRISESWHGLHLVESSYVGVHAIWQVDGLFLLATALLVAFARPFDRLARLGALTLATFSVGLYFTNMPPGYAAIWRNLPVAVGALLWLPNVCIFLFGPIGLTFFVQFPRPLFSARWPWILIWLPALVFVPADIYATFLIVHHPAVAAGALPGWVDALQNTLYPVYGLADLGALVANYSRLRDVNERRRLRLLLAGGAAAVLPALARWPLLIWAPDSAVTRFLGTPVPDVFVAAVFLLFPCCFAYSVLRHRLFDIRVIVRLGLQYAVARGLLILFVPVLALGLFADMLAHGDRPLIAVLEERGWVCAGLAIVAAAAHLKRAQWGDAVDRRFFREQYDARRVLGDVVDGLRSAGSFARAAPGVAARIESALHPELVAILERSPGAGDFHSVALVPAGHPPLVLAADSAAMARLRSAFAESNAARVESGGRQGEPFRWSRASTLLDSGAASSVAAQIHLVLPVVMSPDRAEAVFVLGAKRSGEPYTREDLQLLDAVAGGLALLFERETLAGSGTTGRFEECPRCGTCSDSGSGSCARDGAALSPVPLPRTLAGRYRLERRRGRGGMGTVYEAADTALGRRVAVKVIREEYVSSAAASRRFAREARVAAAFDHPNVVTVHDYGIEAGTRAFLVMELLEGVTLREELRGGGPLGPARALEILRPVCDAVDVAHHRQLVHRDLKPENIFLSQNPVAATTTVKILDFGIAKSLEGSEDALETLGTTDTGLGVLVGTAGYMPPEQLLGGAPGISWDVWALAVVAYEILAGALPFPATSRETCLQAVLAGACIPLDRRLPNAPARWQEFFARALALDRTRRPPSAAEFFVQLQQALT